MGLVFDTRRAWELSPIKQRFDFIRFLRQLPLLFDTSCVAHFEVTSMDTDIREFIIAHEPDLKQELVRQTYGCLEFSLFMIKKCEIEQLHMLLSSENIAHFCDIAEGHNEHEICDHFHVYRDNTVLLDFCDVPSNSVFVSGDIAEDQIKLFCNNCGLKYARLRDDCPEV